MAVSVKRVLLFLAASTLLHATCALTITCILGERSKSCHTQYGHRAICTGLYLFQGGTAVLTVQGDEHDWMRATDAVVAYESGGTSSCYASAGELTVVRNLQHEHLDASGVRCRLAEVARDEQEGRFSGINNSRFNRCGADCITCRRRRNRS